MAGFSSRIALVVGATLLLSIGAAALSIASGSVGFDPKLAESPLRLLGVFLIPLGILPGLALILWMLPAWSRDCRNLEEDIRTLAEDDVFTPGAMSSPELTPCAAALAEAAEKIRLRREALQDNAFRDALTGLPNRRPFMDNLTREASASIRNGRPLSLVMADLDHFKALNDTYGHQAGDRVLRHVAGRFSNLVRHSDMVSRFGGEEFAILLPGASMATALEITHQLRNALRSDPLELDGQRLQVSCSFGVAELLECRLSTPDQLLHHADMALYEAKRQGRDRIVPGAPVGVEQPPTGPVKPACTVGEVEPAPPNRRSVKPDWKPIPGGSALDHDTLALMGCTFSMLQVMPDKHRVVRDMIQQVASVLQCERVSVLLADPEHRRLVPVAALGLPGLAHSTEIRIPGDLRGWFDDLTGGSARIGHEGRGPVLLNADQGETRGAVLYLPVMEYDDILGVIVATDFPQELRLTPRQETVLVAISAIGASALKSCDIYGRLERHWIGSIEGLCEAIISGCAGQGAHLARVDSLCRDTARELGRHDKDELQSLQLAAYLYDIGKMGVPRSILNKRGRLRGEEIVAVQDHCRLGAAIVGTLPGLERLTQVVLHHHEHYDGNGYPDGLIGDAIPLESRIIAVVDAYEAMTSDRPYRRATTPRHAVEVLRAGAGTQFDPEVVAAFLRTRQIRAALEGPIADVKPASDCTAAA